MPGDITTEFERNEFSRAPDPNPVGNTYSVGFADAPARGDHVHAYGRMYGCTVQRLAQIAIAPNSLGRIPWDTRAVDPQGFIAPSLTLPQTDLRVPIGCGGRYLASVKIYAVGGVTITPPIRSLVHVVQTTAGGTDWARNPLENGGYGSASAIFNAVPGDIFGAEIYFGSGGPWGWQANFDLIRLGPIQ